MDIGLSGMALQIKYCCSFSHPAGWQEARAWPDLTLFILRSGSLSVTVNDRTDRAEAGDVLFFLPSVRAQLRAEEDCSLFFAGFTLSALNRHDLFQGFGDGGRLPGSVLAAETSALTAAFPPGQSPVLFSPGQYAAFLTFTAALLERAEQLLPFSPTAVLEEDRRLSGLLHRMEEASPEMIPIRTLAAEMGMSEKYFIQYFRSRIGISPRRFMNRQRMNTAARLLSDPGISLEEAAQRTGFSDRYAFSKAFSKYYGEAPGAFRRRKPE